MCYKPTLGTMHCLVLTSPMIVLQNKTPCCKVYSPNLELNSNANH